MPTFSPTIALVAMGASFSRGGTDGGPFTRTLRTGFRPAERQIGCAAGYLGSPGRHGRRLAGGLPDCAAQVDAPVRNELETLPAGAAGVQSGRTHHGLRQRRPDAIGVPQPFPTPPTPERRREPPTGRGPETKFRTGPTPAGPPTRPTPLNFVWNLQPAAGQRQSSGVGV